MYIPTTERAIIDTDKLRGYLLSPSHPVGRYKAAFFAAMGYTQENGHLLEKDLRDQHLTRQANQVRTNSFGEIYEVVGDINTPSGKIVCVKSVWIVLNNEDRPRLVTAYPGP